MKCSIYSCPIKENEFLIMPENKPIIFAPTNVQADYKNSEIIKTIQLDAASNFTNLNSTEALENLTTNNYYVFNGSYSCVMDWDGIEGI